MVRVRDKAPAIAARLQAGTVWLSIHGGMIRASRSAVPSTRGTALFGVEGLKAVSVPQVISG